MMNLIINECAKLFRRPGTIVMLAIIAVLAAGLGGYFKYDEVKHPSQENVHWKKDLQTELKEDRETMASFGKSNQNMKKFYERQIAIKEYRISNDMAPEAEQNVWTFVRDTKGLISIVGVFTIIVAAGMVSSEFSWGTIKLLLIRPTSRVKILLSKYLTLLLFSLMLLSLLFTVSALAGLIFFGLPESSVPHLAFTNGEVVERSIFLQLIGEYLLSSIGMLMLATMAFMISTVFRNSSLAVGISLFLLLMGDMVTKIFAGSFTWAKYVLFANTDLSVYFDGVPLVEGMTFSFSVIMLVVYFLIFQLLAFGVFSKRDVAA
ncbi:ABC transporter permease [Mesobacillus zeae]|uniref:ABC transporter permease n=1 Tax=Mesobacillus zeae TaxID=1917180 RepID=A0A398B032_9BACI|nr:ABC transporter permease [Mesobacillus zeae]RID82268.1 ABC transporter permease [Mesobacillus zeae]